MTFTGAVLAALGAAFCARATVTRPANNRVTRKAVFDMRLSAAKTALAHFHCSSKGGGEKVTGVMGGRAPEVTENRGVRFSSGRRSGWHEAHHRRNPRKRRAESGRARGR